MILFILFYLILFKDGQTGSGKTFTMVGIQKFIAEDLYHLFDSDPRYQSGNLEIGVSFFEIYGGRCQVNLIYYFYYSIFSIFIIILYIYLFV